MVFNFRGQLQCRMGGGGLNVPLKLTPSSGFRMFDGRQERNLENPCVEGELRAGEEGARNDTGERHFAHRRFRVPDSQENELGDE